MKQVTNRMEELAGEGIDIMKEREDSRLSNLVIHWTDWYSRALKTLELAFGVESELYRSFLDSRVSAKSLASISKKVDFQNTVGAHLSSQLGLIMSAVSILKDEWYTDVEDQAVSETMGSLEKAAVGLLDDGLKDAAAVLGRVVLEQKLDRLCKRHGISLGKKKPTIHDYTDELYSCGKLRKHEMRAVQRWADIGNSAVHIKHDEYMKKDVGEMLAWIRDFD